MRWFWVDRFTEFVAESHACGFKNVSLDAEAVDEYLPGYPVLPPTLIIEGLAQLGGILVGQKFAFERPVVLAKVSKAVFHLPARTGDRLDYRAELDAVQTEGATVTGTSYIDGETQAEIDLMFAFLEEGRFTDGPLFNQGELASMMRLMRFFHVAVDADGNRLPHYDSL